MKQQRNTTTPHETSPPPVTSGKRGVPAELAATGVIVVLGVPAALASQLAVPGGIPPEHLHLTLAFLGTTATLGEARLRTVRESIQTFAQRTSILQARVTGVGRFSGPQGLDAAYVSIDAPELPAFREALLCELAQGAGIEADQTHGFTPHVTLAFIPPEESHPYGRVEPLDVPFETLELWVGPHHDVFPLKTASHHNTPCEVAEAAEAAAGTTAFAAIEAVVSDWTELVVRETRDLTARERTRAVLGALDTLHTQALAAHLAAPVRSAAGVGREATLEARAQRIRSVETDLNLIFETIARRVSREGNALSADQFEERLREALQPLLAWAASTDPSTED